MSDDLARVSVVPVPSEPDPQVELAKYLSGPGYEKYGRFVFAVMSSIPWIGSVMAAAATLHAEQEQGRVNLLMYRWLEEHQHAYKRLEATVAEMVCRVEQLGSTAQERLQEEPYLGLVRRGFKVWDESATDEKRAYVRRTLINAAGTRMCSDDVVRLFLQWIEQYDELHFRVIRVVYRTPGSSRADMWDEVHGTPVRDNSAEADLFKMIIRDLSTGSVMRQHRETTHDGRFLSRAPQRRQRRSEVLASPFDDDKPYELTELGSQFVHYALEEAAPRFGSDST
jgi:hypothetical protein